MSDEPALGWIDDGRHDQSLTPCVPQPREWWKRFGSATGISTNHCAHTSRLPRRSGRRSWESNSTNLFSTVTGYDALEQRIGKTKADKTHGRMVLEHPEIPLANNPAELEARIRVRKQVVSYGPRSPAGAQVGDAMERLLSAARKLGVNFSFHT